jgi:hypothetical protein
MAFWLNRWFPGRAEEERPSTVTLYAAPLTITIAASTASANLVIRELTNEFAEEIKRKADELDKGAKKSS